MIIQTHQLTYAAQMGTSTIYPVREISIGIPKGQFVALVGPSGSGKSTLLGLLAGLDHCQQGSIEVAGHTLMEMTEDQLAAFRGNYIGFVFQSFQLLSNLTALENIRMPLEIAKRATSSATAWQLLEQMNLTDRAHHYPSQLSGGEQQRVAVARAFALNPPVILADEPSGNLDSANGQNILNLLCQLHQNQGVTMVVATHDPEIAAKAERVIRLQDGQVVSDTLNQSTAQKNEHQ